jgi:hypothetical protein
MNNPIGFTKYFSLERLFWLIWGMMLVSSVLVVPFMKPLYQNWNITEWTIDYSNGFVRRGLLGAGINWLRQWGIEPLSLIFVTAISTYICTTLLWVKAIKINQLKFSQSELFLLLFNPCLILFFTIDGSPLRKDILPILFSMISLWIMRSIVPRSHRSLLKLILFSFWLVVSGVILALSHEGIALFLWFPTHWLLYTTVLANFSSIRLAGFVKTIVFLPTLVACIAAVIWHGEVETTLAICQNWESLIAANCHLNTTDLAAISALSWDISKAWQISGFTLIDNGAGLLWCIPFLFWTGIHLRIASKVSMSVHLPIKLAAWIGITAVPLYLIGWDWGRWFTIQSMLGLSIIPILADSAWSKDLEEQLDILAEAVLLKWLLGRGQDFSRFILIKSTQYFRFSARTIAISSLVGLPHCCITVLGILSKGTIGGFIFTGVRLFTHYIAN